MSRIKNCGATVIKTTTTLAVIFGLSLTANAQFQSDNVKMYSQVTLGDMGASGGNDCWGYTSPSGREYAIMGNTNSTAFIEITDPANPVILLVEPHAESTTADMKIFQHYAYACGDRFNLQVFDMGDIDNGNVSLVNTVGFRTHNFAMNEESGFAYLLASSVNSGITALDLSDPVNPSVAGSTNPSGNHIHDAQIVTYNSGPYSGREIAFCPSGQSGFEIIDVTNKSAMKRLAHVDYTGQSYSHQGWLNEERTHFYMSDELDETDGKVSTTTTYVFNVIDLENPFLESTFTGGTSATDHNLYIRDGFIYEANYRAGLQIFDARTDALNPPLVGWFDTHPSSDRPGFEGAWSVYPFFPSGTVIVSDRQEGLIILDASVAVESRMSLTATALVGGQEVTLEITAATPGQNVFFAYGLNGEAFTRVASLGITLELASPKLAARRTADGSGAASFNATVPKAFQGQTVWLQAAEKGNISNLIEDIVQ